jgi:hypothetical protein
MTQWNPSEQELESAIREAREDVQGFMDRVCPITFKVQCQKGHLVVVQPGDPLWTRLYDREQAGYADAMCIGSSECPTCKAEQEEAQAYAEEMLAVLKATQQEEARKREEEQQKAKEKHIRRTSKQTSQGRKKRF